MTSAQYVDETDCCGAPASTGGPSERDELLQAGYDAGMRALVGREHSTLELKRKLMRKGHAADVVDAVLVRLQTDGALSDERFVDVFVRSRVQRGDGPIKIRLALAQRGISDRQASTELASCGANWLDQAFSQVQKRFGLELDELKQSVQTDGHDEDYSSEDPAAAAQRLRQRIGRFLNTRGYPSDVVVDVLEGLPGLSD